MSTSVKRACDACHRRKVKCDGINPCRNCSSAQLTCTYNAIPQKKGPKGSRAKVISELRETQRQTLSSKAANRLNGGQSPPCSPTLAPTPGLLTGEMVRECMDFFFANMYPSMPILHRERLQHQSLYADQNVDTYCLLTAMCAFIMIQPGMGMANDSFGLDNNYSGCSGGAHVNSGTVLLQETLRVRKSYDYLETPTQNSLVTSFFLYACYFGMDSHNKAWFHLREATTLAIMLNLQKEETYHHFDVVESSRRRRLYWLLFVTERSYALARHRPLTLQATINLPTEDDDPTDPQSHHLNGFVLLVNIYRPFDDHFISLWNKTRTDCSPDYLLSLQKQLTDALPLYINSTENQNAELRTSQQWLRTKVWEMGIENGCMSSTSNNRSMTFQYPVDIARDLARMTTQFTNQSMEVHGVAFIEKLFDVACSLTDILPLLPQKADPFTAGPRDYLEQFVTLLSNLRRGDHRFLPLLLEKVHALLPGLTNPMLQVVPEHAIMCPEVDIFDGFGSTGVSVAPSYNHMAPSGPADYKMDPQTVAPYDKRVEDLSSPSAGDSTESSPFNTPQTMGNGMEFPGFSDYGGYHDMSQTHGMDFKREFEGNPNHAMIAGVRRPPIRQGSGSSYGIPRSIPEYHHFPGAASGGGPVGGRPEDMGHGVGDMGFR